MGLSCSVINNETGEIINDCFVLETFDDIQRKRKASEKAKINEQFKQLQSEYFGYFVFFIFNNLEELTKILNDADLVKFIYMGTYIKPDGTLKLDNNITYINKKRLKEIMVLSDKAFYRFFKILVDNQLILEQEDKIYMNLGYFYRGKEKDYKKVTKCNMTNFTRLYIKTTRDLYLNTAPKEHSKLAIVYKLLPYVNWKYNILCTNINEETKEHINALTIEDVLNIIHYSKNQLSRFKSIFYSIKCNENQLFKTVQGDANYLNSTIIVNPSLYYRGNNIEEIESLIALFGINASKKSIH